MSGDITPLPLHSFKARTRTAISFTFLEALATNDRVILSAIFTRYLKHVPVAALNSAVLL
jgi:hypothetical protein